MADRISDHASWTQEHLAFVRARAREITVADIRVVSLYFTGSAPTRYIVHKDEVSAFVEASKRLHFEPGINPANGVKTSRIYQIDVEELLFSGPYWWTVPSLDGNNDPAGARILEGNALTRKIVFEDPAHAAEDEDD